ncbi:hypothetical protein BD779DRAFT_1442927 [Infundibulicybe gibba]|nr:hypothetical protein BD779DRAFT_1442927 [Infundibulicybe gibba]
MIQLRTGHIPLNQHLHRIKKADDPLCPNCGVREETVRHLLLICSKLNNARDRMLRRGGAKSRNLHALLTDKTLIPLVYQFIDESKRLRSVFGTIMPPKFEEDSEE